MSDDPERAWARIAPHALHETNSYAQWLASAGGGVYRPAEDADVLRAGGSYVVVTPQECVTLLTTLRQPGNDVVALHPLRGGLDPRLGWESLELFADKVLPALDGARGDPPGEV
ncbi:hypothetical protein [Frankia sp. QA3]|uniref:hypothetical protein n=1 Tax=Frankia sp. QA3 TaxID=710111 RepID=UPI0002E0AAC5|nr:hypothetical protein [Frankia sp. QA3]